MKLQIIRGIFLLGGFLIFKLNFGKTARLSYQKRENGPYLNLDCFFTCIGSFYCALFFYLQTLTGITINIARQGSKVKNYPAVSRQIGALNI
jgi:hypothetical protein